MERWSKWIVAIVGILGVGLALGFVFNVHLPWEKKYNTGDPAQDVRKQIYDDLGVLHDTIESYAVKENHGKVPAFTSEHLPPWYAKYGGPDLEPDVTYLVPNKIVGMLLDDLHHTTFILATGPKAAKLFPRRGVAGIDYKLN